MEDAGQLWAITNGNSPQSMKVAREGVRLLYCLQHSGLLLRTSAQEMAAIRLQSKNRRIAADSISIVGNVLSIIGIFVPPLLFLGIGASIPASAYRIKKDADHRCMERKAKHEESAIEAIAGACFENFGKALYDVDILVYAAFVEAGLLEDLKSISKAVCNELCALVATTQQVLSVAQKSAQAGSKIAKIVEYASTADDVVSVAYSGAQVARAVDLAGDVKDAFTVAAAASQLAKALGGIANGVAILADAVSLGVDISDDGSSHISKTMISMANRLEQLIAQYALFCPEMMEEVNVIVDRLESSPLYNFRRIDECFTTYLSLPKYGDVIECAKDDEESSFAFCLGNGEFLEFVPEYQSAFGKRSTSVKKFIANYAPIDKAASYASDSCTIRGRMEYSKFRIYNKIDSLVLPSSIQRMKLREEDLRAWGKMDYNVFGQNPEHIVNYLRSGFGYSFQSCRFCENLFDREQDPFPTELLESTLDVRYLVEEAE